MARSCSSCTHIYLQSSSRFPFPQTPPITQLPNLRGVSLATDFEDQLRLRRSDGDKKSKVEHCFKWHDDLACRNGGYAGHCGENWDERCIYCKNGMKVDTITGRCVLNVPNEDIPIGLGGGKSLIGLTGEEAKAAIEAIDPSLEVDIVPKGSPIPYDLREDRVFILVDKHGKVYSEPHIG